MREIVESAEHLADSGVYLFFKHQAHFLNPLIPEEAQRLSVEPALSDLTVLRVVKELLPERLPGLLRGIYSPVPIARSLDAGESFEDLLGRFRYEMVRVDEDQVWWWQERRVATRIQTFFTENLFWQPTLEIWYVEYRVSAEWWDKCYFECEITPLVGSAIESTPDGTEATLNNGRRDQLLLDSLRLDKRERLFCRTRDHGEILFSDSLRFSLLRGVTEDFQSISIGGSLYPLAWPAGVEPGG